MHVDDKTVQGLLADLWMAACGAAEVSAGDNFFATGGNSLRVVRMIAEISDQLDLDLEFDSFFVEPTFGNLQRIVLAAMPIGEGRA